MNRIQKYGDWALVAGAADGLGKAFCTLLAKAGINLIMIDNQDEKLNQLSEELERDYQIETEVVGKDLTDPLVVSNVSKRAGHHQCRLWFYIAAYGPVKPFLDYSNEELETTISLNSQTPLLLARSFVEMWLDKEPAGFMIMSSLSGLRGTKLVVPYAATKAFDWNLIEGLHHEYKDTNLDFITACAGPILTPKYIATAPKKHPLKPRERSAEFIAQTVLDNFGKRYLIIPGIENRIGETVLSKLLPQRAASKIANWVMGAIYSDKLRPDKR
ncbi:MAG: SDR family NAD(P)-dependent oxidoreductase [Cyclobacteriaceae bacterium]